MPNIITIVPEQVKGIRRLFFRWVRGQYGGVVPGVFQVLAVDLRVARPAGNLYKHLHLRKSSPLSRLQREMLATVVNGKVGGAPWLGLHTAAVRRLTGDEHLNHEFATTWHEYQLDAKTRAMLSYASKLTETPSLVDKEDIGLLRDAGWNEQAIWEITALASFFNFSGRLEAASGLPPDQIPEEATFAEARSTWELHNKRFDPVAARRAQYRPYDEPPRLNRIAFDGHETMNGPARSEDVELKVLDPTADLPLLERWLRSPHVVRWWGAQELYVTILAQRPRATDAVITADGKPVGYLCWQTPSLSELEAAGLTDLPEDLVDIDILIGEPAFLGRGVGPKALALALAKLRGDGVGFAGVGTSTSNRAAIRAFEKAGFRSFRDFEDPKFGPCKYMVANLREETGDRHRIVP